MLDPIYERAVAQITHLDDDAQLIVIHPNYTHQHALLTLALQQPGTVYLRFHGDKLTREQLDEQLISALCDQLGSSTLENAAQLVLDECDRAKPSAFNTFIKFLLPALGTRHVLIFGRDLPDGLRQQAAIRAKARLVPMDPELMLPDYLHPNNHHLLEIRALGTGQVFIGGRRINNWDGVLPRQLFFYLVDRGMATRNDIFATFWPKLSSREATNVFHVTKRKINEVLGVDLTTYWSGFYRISPEITLSYDVVRFNELYQMADISEGAEAERYYAQAVQLYHGAYLADTDMPWANHRREELAQSYADVLCGLGLIKEKQGKPQQALGLYLRAASINRQREDIAFRVMEVYDSLGMPGDALQAYEMLQNELVNKLNIQPTPQAKAMAKSLRAKLLLP